MSRDLILACYRSGQMSERQWQDHLKDDVFAAQLTAQQPRTQQRTKT